MTVQQATIRTHHDTMLQSTILTYPVLHKPWLGVLEPIAVALAQKGFDVHAKGVLGGYPDTPRHPRSSARILLTKGTKSEDIGSRCTAGSLQI